MTHTASNTPTSASDTGLAQFGAHLDARRAALALAVAQNPLLEALPADRRQPLAERIVGTLIGGLGVPFGAGHWADDLVHEFGAADQTLQALHSLVDAGRTALIDAALDAVAEGVAGGRAGVHALNQQIDVAHYALAAYTMVNTETAMRRMNNRLDQTLSTTPLATIEWSRDGTITRWNIAAERTFGWTAAEALGKNIFQLVVPGEQIPSAHEVAAIVMRSEHAASTRHENLHRDGRIIVCQWYNAALKDEDGQVIGAFSQIEDVTEMLRSETALRESQEQLIQAQQAALRELSTPLIPLDDGVVAMPLIGAIDSVRAQLVIETLLEGVSANHARVAILDITGVSVVDTQVANALIRAAQAVKLLGARVVLTGIRPEVAQTLVGLGVELTGIATRSSLRAGIQYALNAKR